ncbi:MAG: tetratricopeptide repeat protein [Phycisphaerae bacterium]
MQAAGPVGNGDDSMNWSEHFNCNTAGLPYKRRRHACRACIRSAPVLWFALLVSPLDVAQTPSSSPAQALRADLLELLQRGQVSEAVRAAQSSLRLNPEDRSIRAEVVDFHVSLARIWVEQGLTDDAKTALDAALAIEPANREAASLRARLDRSARRPPNPADIELLIRLELFDSGLEAIGAQGSQTSGGEISALARSCWLGAADDHYACGNFPEAFALYEQALSRDASAAERGGRDAPMQVRWGLCLALTLADLGNAPLAADVSAALGERIVRLPRRDDARLVAGAVLGLLAENGGRELDAGPRYADVAGEAWSVPPIDRKRETTATLRAKAIARLLELYRKSPIDRRGPETLWSERNPGAHVESRGALANVTAETPRIAELVGTAANYHLPRLAVWLGVSLDKDPRAPFCRIQVHPSLASLQTSMSASSASAVARVLRQSGGRVERELHVAADDPWLLSATLPREIAALLLAETGPNEGLPAAVRAGIALQAEPPARRLALRRRLPAAVAPLAAILENITPGTDDLAACDAATRFLLASLQPQPESERARFAALRDAMTEGVQRGLSTRFVWRDDVEMNSAWSAWWDSRRRPLRMPLLVGAVRSLNSNGHKP